MTLVKMYRGGIVATMALSATAATATTYSATASTIGAVFAAAGSGDTIVLRGTFGATKLANKTVDVPIYIDARRATFTNSLNLTNVNGLNVLGGTFDVSSGTSRYGKGVIAYGGSNISFNKSTFIGATNQGGITFKKTTGIKVSNATFVNFWAAIDLISVSDATVSKIKVTKAWSDGVRISDSHFVSVSNSSCSDGATGPGMHPDCVQLWSIKGNPPQSDISITNNTAEGPTQGFTSFNGADGGGIRITIKNNRVNTSYSQGIACYSCYDSIISYNKVTTIPGSPHMTNINVIGGARNIVEHNSIGPRLAAETPVLAARFAANAASFTDVAVTANRQRVTADASLDATGAVPEPDIWALLISGFGIVGLAMRRRPRTVVAA